MAFLKRLLDHLLNRALVEGLANSRTFQRFAVWSNELMKQAAEQGKGRLQNVDQFTSQFQKALKKQTETFSKDFQEELRKLQEQAAKPQQKKP